MARPTIPGREIRLQREESRKRQKKEELKADWEFRLRIIEVIVLGLLTVGLGGISVYIASRTDDILHEAQKTQIQVADYQHKIMEYTGQQVAVLDAQRELQKKLNETLGLKTEDSVAAMLFERLACSDEEKANLIISLLSATDQRAIDLIISNCKHSTSNATEPFDLIQVNSCRKQMEDGLKLYEGSEAYTRHPIEAGKKWCEVIGQNRQCLENIDHNIMSHVEKLCQEPTHHMEAADILYPEFKKIMQSPD